MAWYVNGEKINEQEVQAEATQLKPHYERMVKMSDAGKADKQLIDWSRENVIERLLLRQAAERDGQLPPDEIVEQAFSNIIKQHGSKEQFFSAIGLSSDKEDLVRKDIAARMRFEKFVGDVTVEVSKPSDKEVEKYFAQHSARFVIPEMVRASHIIKHAEPSEDGADKKAELQGLLDRIKAGEDFAVVADELSDCPGNGGDLGLFARGKMVPEFEETVFAMEPGDVSEIFRTQFGFHIAKVTERKPSVPCKLEDVRQPVENEIMSFERQKILEKFIDAEKAKATIEEK